MRTNPDLDPAAIERLRGLGGEKFVREMIGLFLDYVGQKVKEARQAMLAGDLPGVEKAVHPVKSSAGNLGARRVQTLATRIELEARNQNVAAVSAGVAELESAFSTVRERLEQMQLPAPKPEQPNVGQ